MTSPKSAVYCIRNLINEKRYVGSAVHFQKRWSAHRVALRKGSHPNIKLQRAWNKHGESVFVFEVLEQVENKADLIVAEQKWIDVYHAATVGYNIAPKAGSSLGRKASPETKVKLSQAHKGKKFSEEKRQRYLGRVVTEETRRKIAEAHRGKGKPPLSAEHREKLAGIWLGRKHTDASRQKMSLAQSGRTFSEETRAKMSESGRKRAPPSDATRAKLSAAGCRPCSESTKLKISAALKGIQRGALSAEEKLKRSRALKGVPKGAFSDEHKAKLSAAAKARWSKTP